MMTPTRCKICGLTSQADVQAAVALGADAIGLVFYAPSPRAVTIESARAAIRDMPPFVTVTALFVNPSAEEVNEVLSALPQIQLLQFHGEEPADFCRQFARPYIKAVSMKAGVDLRQAAEQWPDAQALLVDTYKPGVPGGSGETFDWQQLPSVLPKPLILAGGLTPDNVAQAVAQVHPYAVDVSGGVEAAKGVKDVEKMAQFLSNLRQADKGF